MILPKVNWPAFHEVYKSLSVIVTGGSMKIGAHFSAAGKTIASLFEGCGKGAWKAVQIFGGSPQRLLVKSLSVEEVADAVQVVRKFNLSVFIHTAYVASLSPSRPNLWKPTVEYYKKLDQLALSLGAQGVVTHVGSGPRELEEEASRDAGKKTVKQMLVELAPQIQTGLFLENVAGRGRSLARTPDDLVEMLEGQSEKLGVCWDTSHGFSQGVPESSVTEIRDLINCLGSKLRVVHLNGVSDKVVFGKHLDRHGSLRKTPQLFNTETLTEWDSVGVPFIIEPAEEQDLSDDLQFLKEAGLWEQ